MKRKAKRHRVVVLEDTNIPKEAKRCCRACTKRSNSRQDSQPTFAQNLQRRWEDRSPCIAQSIGTCHPCELLYDYGIRVHYVCKYLYSSQISQIMSFSFDTSNFTYGFLVFYFLSLYYFWCSSVLVFLLKPGAPWPVQILEGHFASNLRDSGLTRHWERASYWLASELHAWI